MIEELKRYVVARPFKPFRVVLRDGLNLDVTRVGQLAIGRTRFMFADGAGGQTREFPIEHVASLQAIDVQERLDNGTSTQFDTAAGNGGSYKGNMIDELKQHVIARPFKPFRVVLRDGGTLDVTRVAQLAIGRTVFMYADDNSGRGRLLPINQVTSLQMLDNATAA